MALFPAKIDLHVRWAFIAPLVAFGAAVVLSYLGGNGIGGNSWIIAIRNELFDWGVSKQFVANYVVHALLDLPQWAVVAGITFFLGLTHIRRAHQFAWMFSVAVPFANLLVGSLTLFVYDLLPSLSITLRAFFLIPACGTLIGFAAWWAGYLLRGRHGRGIGCCPACGYDLRGSGPTACPECGHKPSSAAI